MADMISVTENSFALGRLYRLAHQEVMDTLSISSRASRDLTCSIWVGNFFALTRLLSDLPSFNSAIRGGFTVSMNLNAESIIRAASSTEIFSVLVFSVCAICLAQRVVDAIANVSIRSTESGK